MSFWMSSSKEVGCKNSGTHNHASVATHDLYRLIPKGGPLARVPKAFLYLMRTSSSSSVLAHKMSIRQVQTQHANWAVEATNGLEKQVDWHAQMVYLAERAAFLLNDTCPK